MPDWLNEKGWHSQCLCMRVKLDSVEHICTFLCNSWYILFYNTLITRLKKASGNSAFSLYHTTLNYSWFSGLLQLSLIYFICWCYWLPLHAMCWAQRLQTQVRACHFALDVGFRFMVAVCCDSMGYSIHQSALNMVKFLRCFYFYQFHLLVVIY